jgi:hypothetical protein
MEDTHRGHHRRTPPENTLEYIPEDNLEDPLLDTPGGHLG